LLAACCGLGTATGDARAPSPSGLALREIARFDQPVHAAQAPGEPRTLYVVEQAGRVIAVRKGRKLGRPFLDLSERVRSGPEEADSEEAGLLSIAFDPDYQRSGRFYLFYTGLDGNNYVDSFRRASGRAVRALRSSRRRVIGIRHPWLDSHNGGQLQFGPDGHLWISTGDGGCCGDYHDQARTLGSLLGKLLRIDPRPGKRGYIAPADNPLLRSAGANAVYAWGLRNPWRFSFDRLTGALAIADVGDNESAREEINLIGAPAAAGVNFGWPEYEGFARDDPARPGPGPLVAPISQYRHTSNRCAITGGYVVRDPALPQLWGRYVYADFCGGRIRSLAAPPLGDGLAPPGRVADDRDEGVHHRYVSSFGEGLAGQIYVVSLAGPVFRLVSRAG
jgi:glucose/arabinose dehydrogenase